jgi:HAD superfamily hydrolase (TIGR01549 family)
LPTRVSGDNLKTRTVLFDLGGTLLVMRRDRIFRRVLSEWGKEASLDRVHSAYISLDPWWVSHYGSKFMTPEETKDAYRDLDARVYLDIYPGADQETVEEFSMAVRSRWPELEKEIPLELYPDTEPILSWLHSSNYTMGLVSNAPPDTEKVVETLGLRKYLSSIVISGIVGYTKPHPEIFRIALKELGVNAGEAIHVGDLYEADVLGASNAGIRGILLDRDGSHEGLDCPRIQSLAEVRSWLT